MQSLLEAIVKKPKAQTQRREPEPEFTTAKAAKLLKGAQTIRQRRDALNAEEEASAAEYDAAVAKREADAARIAADLRALNQERDSADRARRFLLAGSEPTPEELRLKELGLQLQKKAGELRIRHNVHASTMVPPDEHADTKRLVELDREIADCEKAVARLDRHSPSRWAGMSGPENKLNRLLTERRELEPRISLYRTQYEHFREIQAVKAESQKCYDERDKLQREREEAVVAKAIASAK